MDKVCQDYFHYKCSYSDWCFHKRTKEELKIINRIFTHEIPDKIESFLAENGYTDLIIKDAEPNDDYSVTDNYAILKEERREKRKEEKRRKTEEKRKRVEERTKLLAAQKTDSEKQKHVKDLSKEPLCFLHLSGLADFCGIPRRLLYRWKYFSEVPDNDVMQTFIKGLAELVSVCWNNPIRTTNKDSLPKTLQDMNKVVDMAKLCKGALCYQGGYSEWRGRLKTIEELETVNRIYSIDVPDKIAEYLKVNGFGNLLPVRPNIKVKMGEVTELIQEQSKLSVIDFAKADRVPCKPLKPLPGIIRIAAIARALSMNTNDMIAWENGDKLPSRIILKNLLSKLMDFAGHCRKLDFENIDEDRFANTLKSLNRFLNMALVQSSVSDDDSRISNWCKKKKTIWEKKRIKYVCTSEIPLKIENYVRSVCAEQDISI